MSSSVTCMLKCYLPLLREEPRALASVESARDYLATGKTAKGEALECELLIKPSS